MNDALSRSNKSSKDSSRFAVFEAKKNGEDTKMTNGDSWDKSALLSIQKELTEFSADHHSLAAEQLSMVENHFKSAQKGSAKKSNKDASIPSEKSSRSKHSKNNKLRKLNSKNFFLHSEFSPFLSWGDFNKFSTGQEHISEIMLSNRSPEWYDSPHYKELAAAHGHYKLSFPRSVGKNFEKSPKQIETHQSKPQLESVQSTPASVPPKPKIETEHIIQYNIPSKASLLTAEQRCNSEKGEPCVPWRKNRSRAKSALPVGHSLVSIPVCKRSNPEEGGATPFKKEVQTIEDQTSTSSTPFSISQLLTPVIPSRHGTGTSDILQAVLSPTALEFPQLPEREMYPLPELKREGYKSIASNLLFNLKDNRKRVKTMYSPPKFKGLDSVVQSKESPLPKGIVSKDLHEIPDISEDKSISSACQKAIISPMSPLLEFADTQSCFSQGIANGGMPDDYLALSLLQTGSPLKSNRSPAANKATYPSLQLYRKASPEDINIRANAQTVVDTSSCVFTDKYEEHSKHYNTESNNPSKLFKGVIKALPGKMNPLESVTENPTVSLNRESVLENKSGISPNVSLTKPDEQAICDGSQTKDQLKNVVVSKQKSPVKEKEPNRKLAGAKHMFSARQNNYIKSQRFVSTDIDDNDHDGDSSADKVLLDIKDTNYNDEWSKHYKNSKTKEIKQEEHNTGIHKDKVIVQHKVGGPLLNESVNVRTEATTGKDQNSIISKSVLETQSEQQVKIEAFSKKGNISGKRALFASMEQVPKKTTVPLKKDNIVIDKFNLAKVALEEVIAEREQKKLKSKAGGSINDRNRVGCEKEQDGHELTINGEEQQMGMNTMSEKEKNAKDGKGLKRVSAFKTSAKTVQIMSEEVAKHGVSSLYIGDQERNTDNASKGDKVLGHQEKALMNKNISHAKEHTKRDDHLESGDIPILGQYKEELGVKKKGSFYKPKVPPRRGRSDCLRDDRVVQKTEGNKDLKSQGNASVKTEEIICKEVSKDQPSQSKNQGPVRGNVSALKKKYDKESGVHYKDVHKCLHVDDSDKSVEGLNELAAKDKIKHKTVIPKLTVSCPESETYSIIEKDMDSENESMSDSPSKVSEKGQEQSDSERKHDDTQDFQKVISDLTNNKQEIPNNKVNGTKAKEEGFVSLKESGDNQNKSKSHCKSYVKDFLNVLLGLSSSERVKSEGEDEEELTEGTTLSFESIKAETGKKDSITEHDIGQSQSFSTSNLKQTHHSSLSSNSSELSLLYKSEQGSQSKLENFSSKTEVCDVKEKVDGKSEDFQRPKIDSCSFSNQESESDVSDRVVSPPSDDVEKTGWVHCLIESAKNLTQISHSHNSPKDLHKMDQQLSQKECLNAFEKCEEDLDVFKDCVQSPVVRSPQPTMHLLSSPASQLNAVKDGKLSVGRISVSEEEERDSAVSTVFEKMDSCATSVGDTMEENISSTALAEDAEGFKAPSERSGSVCSGNDSHGQNKPPVVPPKSEKALRRAMKIATQRIQKAEANSKSERKGRSTDKSARQKVERRHHSTDKVRSDRLEHWPRSSDQLSSKHSEHYLDETLEPKTQRSDKNARHHSGHKSQNTVANDPSKTLQHATKGKDRQTSKTGDSESHSSEKRQDHKSNHMDNFENSNTNNNTDRLGRSNEKHSPRKLERRTQSLNRFSRDKLENKPKSTDKAGDELSKEGLHHSTPKVLPLRKNSIDHSYAPATTNIVTQSFPFTQRKLLQDPDSGQLFLVDMPVQVKTKTFFDPETQSYVQLQVQSPEAAVRQAQPLDVVNTPPLVVYHGFVPVPVSSLPSQKPVVRTAGSIIPPDDLEDFTPNKKQMQDDFYHKHSKEVHPNIESVYTTQDHTPEEEIDSVR
ncbi:uncharacterized protein LOC127633905 isoform X2 [Xyrauchen texanus]|nr:uncharacterized protein LOC127633905 isoform X2 [Xyrauchen texanus]